MPDTTQQNPPTTDNLTTVKQALTPSGQNGTMSIGGALAVLFIAYEHTHGVDFPAGVEASLAVVMTIAAGYFHEFMAVLLHKLRS